MAASSSKWPHRLCFLAELVSLGSRFIRTTRALEDLKKGEDDLMRAEHEIEHAKEEIEEARWPDYVYFIGEKRFVTEHEHLTGQQIKASDTKWVAGNSLELEAEGHEPNRIIADHETVHFHRDYPTHFISVPPANFGAA
jgi:hypothetical protein